MRMTLRQWEQRIWRPLFGSRQPEKRSAEEAQSTAKPLVTWAYTPEWDWHRYTVQARTRSEARAKLKAMLKVRIPVSARVERVDGQEG